jgi:septum formation protein
VLFDTVPEREIEQYIATPEPYDKAGAYAIQGFASLWITGIEGDYFNVVGFPVKRFADLLREEFDLSLAEWIGETK